MSEQSPQIPRRWWAGGITVATMPTILVFLPSGLVLKGLPYCLPGLLLGFGIAWLGIRYRPTGLPRRLLPWLVAYAFGAGPWIALHLGGHGSSSDLIVPMHLGPFASSAEGLREGSLPFSVPLAVAFGIVTAGSIIRPRAAWVLFLAPFIYGWCFMGSAWLMVSV